MYGYYRVSTADQNPDHRIDVLRRVGVAAGNVFGDTAGGAKASRPSSSTAKRPQIGRIALGLLRGFSGALA
ncbi:recombinase family protein [Streptosporangium minutum]|uniref:recombinase family protein n=1 Tax=Streptosporangium minutum TaxID=569862 RepID=UPI000D529427|nr:recombinase family protein [Streptosporangium minutum]